jgi:hypothetical protein
MEDWRAFEDLEGIARSGALGPWLKMLAAPA